MAARRLSTRLIHTGVVPVEGAVVPPIFPSVNYLQHPSATYGEVTYQQLSNTPQHRALHAKLADAEEADEALVLASGMAAVSTALLSVLSAGDHLLIQRNVYGGTATFVRDDLARLGVAVTTIDATDPSGWEAARTPRTKMIWVEGISNPLLEVPALDAVIAFARRHGLVAAIDNTFLSPVGFRPIPFGFDLVVHSATKYLNGHSDVVAGVVAGRAAPMAAVRHLSHHLGASLDPFAAYLLDRGLKTLALRYPAQCATAARIATFLASHPAVRAVRYPGLPDDPSHARARRHLSAFGAMVSFELASPEAVDRFLARVTLPANAASLGGVESLVVLPARSSHLGLGEAGRRAIGLSETLVRLSVGLEDADDLVDDLGAALAAAC